MTALSCCGDPAILAGLQPVFNLTSEAASFALGGGLEIYVSSSAPFSFSQIRMEHLLVDDCLPLAIDASETQQVRLVEMRENQLQELGGVEDLF